MKGVVDVGGGMRAAYGAGALDYCLEQGLGFDYGIGVSAGSANIMSYFGGQKGRNYRFYMDYAMRKEYMSLGNLLKTGSYINLDYIYGTLSNHDGEDPFDFAAMKAAGKQIYAVATDARNGQPVYFDANQMEQDDYGPMKGSSCVPVVSKAYTVYGIPCYDGGISDPIPVQKALDDGCDFVVVILTRPRDQYRSDSKDKKMAKLMRKYPEAGKRLAGRAKIYNDELDLAKQYEKKGKALILAPKDIGGMTTLKKDAKAIDYLYRCGYEDAKVLKEIPAFSGK